MNLLTLSTAYVKRRPWGTLLNVVLLALGLATIVVLLLFSRQVERNLTQNAQGIDLVVGAKGSPLQLILSAVYHADSPTGNVPVAEAEQVLQNPAVAEAIPLALGDAYRGFRIVGTTLAYPAHYGAEVAEGRLWEGEGEVVVGPEVVAAQGLALGDAIVSSHGLAAGGPGHEEHPLTVVGMLAETGTVLDRLVLTGVETVWAIHGAHAAEPPSAAPEPHAHADEAAAPPTPRLPVPLQFGPGGRPGQAPPREYTALLVRYASPMAAVTFPRYVNTQTSLMAASPAIETQRLLSLLGFGLDALRVFGIVLIAAAALGVGIALYNAMQERRYDLAVMRSLGASRGRLLAHVLLEGVLLAAAGALLGLVLGHVAAEALGAATAGTRTQLPLTGWTFVPEELGLVALALGLGALAALVPALQAYRVEIARTLARG